MTVTREPGLTDLRARMQSEFGAQLAAQLARLPVMTKAQMMAGFDDVLTDRRLTLARVEDHLRATGHEPALLAGDYVCRHPDQQPAPRWPARPAGHRPRRGRDHPPPQTGKARRFVPISNDAGSRGEQG